MNKKIKKSFVSVFIIVICAFLTVMISSIGNKLLQTTYDNRLLLTFNTLLKPLLYLISGIALGIILKQFISIKSNKKIFIVLVAIASIIYIITLLMYSSSIFSYLNFKISIDLSTTLFNLFGFTYSHILQVSCAYIIGILGMICVFVFPVKNKTDII
ncbi:hypothetical protein SAMN05216249_1442 [Acetitomaculum ruminis DSM 5522]|uniref:Uncharacterized protein n=1 Tax=Acetitomaculum ruminis DSM 5522 TaxID=1120918 RepID=A0A1I1ARX9_9FIRM|nr:hypothetical protein [Acetitomaculum ruminis]SFB40774.1 hypothetical protein SAMN05216249_1442 [Acetitomaculum ruminis DSM 5522]